MTAPLAIPSPPSPPSSARWRTGSSTATSPPATHLREQELAARVRGRAPLAARRLRRARPPRPAGQARRTGASSFPSSPVTTPSEIFELRRALELPVGARRSPSARTVPDATPPRSTAFDALPADAAWRESCAPTSTSTAAWSRPRGNSRLARAHADLLAEIALCIVQTGGPTTTRARSPASTTNWPTRSESGDPDVAERELDSHFAEGLGDCALPKPMSRAPQRLVLLSAVLFGTTGTAQALGPDGTTPLTVGRRADRHRRGRAGRDRARSRARCSTAAAGRPARALAGGARRRRLPALLLRRGRLDRRRARHGRRLGSGPAFAGLLGWRCAASGRPGAGRSPRRSRWPARRSSSWRAVVRATSTRRASLLALGAGASYALYTVTSKIAARRRPQPRGRHGRRVRPAAPSCSPVLALGDTAWLPSPAAPRSPSTWASIPTALAYVLFARGLEKLRPRTSRRSRSPSRSPRRRWASRSSVSGPARSPASGALLVLSGLLVLARAAAPRDASPSALASA